MAKRFSVCALGVFCLMLAASIWLRFPPDIARADSPDSRIVGVTGSGNELVLVLENGDIYRYDEGMFEAGKPAVLVANVWTGEASTPGGDAESSGPTNEQVVTDVQNELIKRAGYCGSGKMTRTVNKFVIVGRRSNGSKILVQAAVNFTSTGPCQGAGTYDCEVSIEYEPFGSEWRQTEYGFDVRIIR